MSSISLTVTKNSIQEAINRSSSGDTVFIKPGIYEENLILKDGVNLHFENGAILQLENPTDHLITDNGKKVNCKITGYGEFRWINALDDSTLNGSLVYHFSGGGKISWEFKLIYADGFDLNLGWGIVRLNNGTDLDMFGGDWICDKLYTNQSGNGISFKDPNSILRYQGLNFVCNHNGFQSDDGDGLAIIDLLGNYIAYDKPGSTSSFRHIKAKNIYGSEPTSVSAGGKLIMEADNIVSRLQEAIRDDDNGAKHIEIRNARVYTLDRNRNSIQLEGSENSTRYIFSNASVLSFDKESIRWKKGNAAEDQLLTVKGTLLLQGAPSVEEDGVSLLFEGGDVKKFKDPNFHFQKYEWFWTDGICVEDSSGNTGDYRRKYLRSRKVIDNTILTVASDAPPTENDGDEYIIDQAGSPHTDWDGNSNGDHVKYNASNDTWEFVRSIDSEVTSYTRRMFDITNAFSWGSPYGTINIIDFPSLTDTQFAQLSSSEYQERLDKFRVYVYYQSLPENYDGLQIEDIDVLLAADFSAGGTNEATSDEEGAYGDASNANNISCPV